MEFSFYGVETEEVGDGDEEVAAGGEDAAEFAQGRRWIGQVFEGFGADDTCESSVKERQGYGVAGGEDGTGFGVRIRGEVAARDEGVRPGGGKTPGEYAGTAADVKQVFGREFREFLFEKFYPQGVERVAQKFFVGPPPRGVPGPAPVKLLKRGAVGGVVGEGYGHIDIAIVSNIILFVILITGRDGSREIYLLSHNLSMRFRQNTLRSDDHLHL